MVPPLPLKSSADRNQPISPPVHTSSTRTWAHVEPFPTSSVGPQESQDIGYTIQVPSLQPEHTGDPPDVKPKRKYTKKAAKWFKNSETNDSTQQSQSESFDALDNSMSPDSQLPDALYMVPSSQVRPKPTATIRKRRSAASTGTQSIDLEHNINQLPIAKK